MAFNKITQPGVTVEQKARTNTPNIFNPSLIPLVCGPAKEIVNVFDSSGTLNADAKQGLYLQLPKTISQTSFPSPRNNISEVAVEKKTIRTFFNFSNTLTELKHDPGDSFLVSYNHATRACFRSDVEPLAGWDLNPIAGAKTLNFVIDQRIRTITSADKAVTFTSVANATLTTQQVADQINTVWGSTIASSVTLDGDPRPRLQILSPKYGALSSVTIRGGASANTVLGFSAQEERVEGSGFRGQDQSDGTTQTPFIEFFRGDYLLNAVSASFPGGGTGVKYGLMDESGTFTNGKLAALVFTGLGIDLRVGDLMFADGIRPKNAEVMKVEDSRIKLGTLNTILSTFDEEGKVLVAVRDQIKVATLYDPTPFAPRYVWFRAQNLSYPTAGNTTAILTGSVAGEPATAAAVVGTSPVTDFALSGLNLKITVTKDGVELPEQTITFTGVLTNITDVYTYINNNSDDIVASDNGGGELKIVTVNTGKDQAIRINAASTANSKLYFSTSSDTTDIGTDVEFVPQPATLTSAVNTFAMTINMGDILTLQVSDDNFTTSTDITYTWPANTNYANITALLSELNTNVVGTAPNDIVWSNGGGGKLVAKSASYTGKLAGVRIKNNGASNTATGALKINYQLTDSANGVNGISGETLKFKLNDRTKIYTTTFVTNSLVDAITDINNVVGFPVASAVSGTLDKLVLTSTLYGQASKVEVINDSTSTQANLAFGFGVSNRVAVGTGRPNPDYYLDLPGNINIGPEILRNPITGYPYDPAQADIYVQYRGLRRDLSPLAKKNPGLLSISDLDTLTAIMSPITEENPLALALSLMLLNAPNVVCKAIGVDEISDAEPEGTLASYTRIAEFIEAHEIWGIAPLSQAEDVHQMFKSHVDNMSLPENKGERVVFINPKMPTRAVDKKIASGLAANSVVASSNVLNIDVNPATPLMSAGINPALPIPYSSQLFITVIVEDEVRNYLVSSVNGVVINVTNTFGATENLDGFFSTDPLTEIVVNSPWGLFVRGDQLTIPGSSLPDKEKIAETVNTNSVNYLDKRVIKIFPESVTTTIDGFSKIVPGYYAAAAYTAVKAKERPQQGLTNFRIKGFTGAINTIGYFNKSQLDTIAGGGTFILINDGDGLPIYARHQLTTDVRTKESQELSIISIIDHAAKLIRGLLKQFIGTSTINSATMDGIATVVDSIRKFLVEELGSLVDLKVNSLFQDPANPDTVILNITVRVPYPLNYIKVTIFI